MKNKFMLALTIGLVFAGYTLLHAQSDYETVQNFKKEVQQIEQSIKDADSLSILQEIPLKIDQLNNKYAEHKVLLDKSLYPDNLDKTIQRLKNESNLRQGDFAQITELQTAVTGLKEEIDTLRARNTDLARQFALLENQSNTSNARIAQLEQVIAQLRVSLQKRDQIVINMINDLLPTGFQQGEQLTSQEKQEVVSKAEKNDILFNVKKAVNDNIRFLDATRLYPEDLRKVKAQHDNFVRIWKKTGPAMVELYSEKKKRTEEFKEIDDAFFAWNTKIDEEVWLSVNAAFADNNVFLPQFTNGKEFTSVVTTYISDEIMNADAKGKDAAKKEYEKFDTTWNEKIKPSWMSFLLDNKMITENDQDSIEIKLATWEDAVNPEQFNWLYIIIAVLAVAVIILLFVRFSPKKIKGSSVDQDRM